MSSSFRPLQLKKSLGQHFLKDESVSLRIIAYLKEQPFSHLLEIGPGAGALTRFLITLEGVDFRAVEIDKEKEEYLKINFPSVRDRIIGMDFLKMEKPFDGQFSVVGNFPYNISTEILFKLMDWRTDIGQVIGMFQKEVAQRIAAPPGNKIYGVTSVLIQAFFEVEYLFEVSAQAFQPPPKVRSAVIRLTPRKDPEKMKSARSFSVLVKTAFNQRRKTLRNAVKSLFAKDILQDTAFNRRAEELSVTEFAELTWKMN